MENLLSELIATNGKVTSQIIKDLIADNATTAIKQKALYDRYKASKLPIQSREFEDSNKINRKINNDFAGEIVDTKTGYFIGHAVSYVYDNGEEKKDTTVKLPQQVLIDDFNLRNNTEDLNAEIAKKAAICGVAYKLLYINKQGLESVMQSQPWETILVYDRSITEPQHALRHYPILDNGKERTRVEWYDNENVTFYISNDKGEFILDTTEEVNPQQHFIDGVPVVAYLNNEEMQGDFEKVIELIDAYDRAISDVNSELEQFRLAYMAMYGVEPTPEVIEMAKKTGAFGLDADGRIEFITKQINDTVIENHLNRIEDNILRFGKTVNFNDDTFGSASGVALKYKLLSLENKCIVAERKFITGERQLYKLLASVWNDLKRKNFDYLKVWYGFKRNLPLDLSSEAQATVQLKDAVSERTRLSLLSFVDDVEYELKQMQQDQEGNRINLDNEV